MQHPGKWWIGLVPLSFVWIVANLVEVPRVERDIQGRTTSALTPSDKVEQAASEVAGRDVRLTGTSVSSEASAALTATVASLHGVRLVRSSFDAPTPAKPYVFSAKREGDTMLLSGNVPSKVLRTRILAEAAAPGRHVVDHLGYASGEPANFADLVAFGLGAAGKLKDGAFSTVDTGYRLTGSAASSADYEATLAAKPPSNSSALGTQIEPPLAKPFDWQAAVSGDTLTLSGMAPSPKARDAIKAKAASLFPKLKIIDTTGVARGAPAGDFAGVAGHTLDALAKLDGGGATIHDAQVTVSGTTRNADDRQAIDKDLRRAVAKPYELALLRLRAPTVSPYPFKVERTDSSVHLTGYAPDDAARQRIEAAAKAQFAGVAVQDDLKVAEGAPEGFTDAVTGTMPALARLNKGSLTLSDGKAEISGEAPYLKAAEEIKTALAPPPGSAFAVKTDIGVAPPLPALDAAACQPKFADLLAKGHIEFETGSAVLSKLSTPLLDGLVAVAQRCQSSSIEVSGHTDTVGAAESNLELSRRRAQAVVDYFAAAGLDTARISAAGFGQDKPIAPNDTPDGRAKNRRIEFQVK